MTHLSLSVLGMLQVSLDGRPVVGFESNKTRALLAYLAVEAERPHSRDELAELLWPNQSDQVARNNLRQTLANLRHAIGDRTVDPAFLFVTRETVQFNASSDAWLDAGEFTDLLTACDTHVHRRPETCKSCAGRLQQASELYCGNFLEQFFLNDSTAFEEWALVKREDLRRLALHALYRLADYHERRGTFELALRHALRQLAFDPWREEAHRQAMRALALSGQRTAALAQYETCRHVLAEELGTEPSRETTTLYEQIKIEDPSARRKDEAEQHTVLPAPATSFIGRDEELADIGWLLENPACRLVTLAGPGGIGKTRLALQAAAEQAESFDGGVYFVSLAPLSSIDFFVAAIADAVKFTFTSQQDPKEQLLRHLRDSKRDMLLLLDNFEQLLAGTGLVGEILQRVPQVTLLVTSRERLNVQGEWVFEVHGLQVPGDERFEGCSAIELFVQSARRAWADFTLSPQDAPFVINICRLAEGIPLAIELAAAWVRVISCQEIAHEIEQSLAFLNTSLRDDRRPDRHRSMQAVFDHSWNLLSGEERRVFRRLSVFRGGFRRDAMQEVAGASLPILAALVDKSLVRRVPHAAERYDMHEFLRQAAHDKLLESGEAEQTCERHMAYLTALAEEAGPEFQGPRQQLWLDRIEMENDNLRAALGWALEHGRAEVAARAVGPLWQFWYRRGYLKEGQRWLEQTLAISNSSPASVRAKMLNGAGAMAYGQADYARATALLAECIALQRVIGDQQGLANTLNIMGAVAMAQRDDDKARALYGESLALFRALGDERSSAQPLNNLANTAYDAGNYAAAIDLHEQSLALSRKYGDKNGSAMSLLNLGWAALLQGADKRAGSYCREALLLYRQLGNRSAITFCLEGLGGVAGIQKQPVRAARLLGAAEALREAVSYPVSPDNLAYYQRIVAAAQSQLDEASFARTWGEGRAMSLEQAVEYALAAVQSSVGNHSISTNV
jgi:predicted ATPase/DNA-binding SARP family transcriptional activator